MIILIQRSKLSCPHRVTSSLKTTYQNSSSKELTQDSPNQPAHVTVITSMIHLLTDA